MGIIPNFSKHLDVQAIKTSIMPKIRHIAIEGDTIAVRIICYLLFFVVFILQGMIYLL